MKNVFILIAFIFIFCLKGIAQTTGAFTVGGDFDKFYPVTFSDIGWLSNAVSEVQIGRSDIHENSNSRGSLMSKFLYHTTQWGNGANFIKTEIAQTNNVFGTDVPFIAGWADGTYGNGSLNIVIWLRGGGTTYHFNAVFSTTVTVYDGVSNPLPFQEVNGYTRTYKTAVDPYVNSFGVTDASAFYAADRINYFKGNVGIGTIDTKGYKLAVAGNMIAESVKVQLQGSWSDFVFAKDYDLPTLKEVETHIKENGHLQGIPSAAEVKTNGVDLGDMNAKLLQKIEELTLYLIENKKETEHLRTDLEAVKQKNDQLENVLKILTKKRN